MSVSILIFKNKILKKKEKIRIILEKYHNSTQDLSEEIDSNFRSEVQNMSIRIAEQNIPKRYLSTFHNYEHCTS